MAASGWAGAVAHMRGNHGLATRQSLVCLGVSERTLRRRVADGLLIPVSPSVVALPGLPLDLVTLTRAAVLAYPRAIPTGPSAAVLLGRGPWAAFDLGSEPWLIHPRRGGFAARYLTHPDVTCVRASGLVVARPVDAVLDMLRFWPEPMALALAERALQSRTLSLDELIDRQPALWRSPGCRQLRSLVRSLSGGTRSTAERRLCDLLHGAGVTGWVANLRVVALGRTYEIDVAFPSVRLAVEVDGRAYHSDAGTFQADRRRQNDLVAAGWTILRFTWADLTERADEVVARILAAKDQPAA